jgi:HEPN domain-containing protein
MSGPPDANVMEARRWLKQASTNLASARLLGQGKIWAQGCFFCQQAAEAALKAVLLHAGERNLRTHSTARLVKRTGAYVPGFADFSRDAPLLDRHYVGTRYPHQHPATTR